VAKNNHNLAFHDHFHTLFLTVRIKRTIFCWCSCKTSICKLPSFWMASLFACEI